MFRRVRTGPLTRALALAPSAGLGQLPARLAPLATRDLVCGFCSTGCGLRAHLGADGAAVNISPAATYPVNHGNACPKGWQALAALSAPNRATHPTVRNARGKPMRVSWQDASSTFVDRVRSVQQEHGPESFAFLGTGQLASEELAFLGALAKHGMGMRHGDGNTRQCMATAVTAYKQSFGFDAPPYTYADFEESDVIVLWGSNLCIAHPILWQRILSSRRQPQIVVIDPRATETSMAASRHVAIRPKADLILAYAIARELIANHWINREYVDAHTEDFEAFATHVQEYDLDRSAADTGLPAHQIASLAKLIGTSDRVSLWWTMGVNQSHQGVRTAQGIINLALMTGNIGRPGTGANSITGQCNAMGSRLFSNTTNLLGGHDFANPTHRAKVAGVLGIDQSCIPTDAGWSYDRIIEGIISGAIKGLWVVGTNPLHSWINQLDLSDALDRLDLLVVQDMYTDTETALRADILLPAAGWGEKTGTFINSERRIGMIERVHRAPGEALADFSIFRLIAEAWGCGEMFRSWSDPEAVFETLRELTRDQPCDITGIEGYDAIASAGGIQWPYPTGTQNAATERRLFADRRFHTPSGKARFWFDRPTPVPEPTSRRYPLVLMTGRGSSSQWHTQTRTRASAVLERLHPGDAYVEISRADADARQIAPHQWVKVVSRRGVVRARAFVTHTIGPGQVFISMHVAVTNRLTFPAFDPHSRQPAYKACAVDVQTIAAWENP